MTATVRPTCDNRWAFDCPGCSFRLSGPSLRFVTFLAGLHAQYAHPAHR